MGRHEIYSTLYRGGEDGDPTYRGRRHDSDRGARGYSNDQTRSCRVSSMQQTRGLPVTSLSLQTVGAWSTVYTHTATCMNELPGQSLVVMLSAVHFDFWGPGVHFESSEFEHRVEAGAVHTWLRVEELVRFRLAGGGSYGNVVRENLTPCRTLARRALLTACTVKALLLRMQFNSE